MSGARTVMVEWPGLKGLFVELTEAEKLALDRQAERDASVLKGWGPDVARYCIGNAKARRRWRRRNIPNSQREADLVRAHLRDNGTNPGGPQLEGIGRARYAAERR